MIEVTEVLYRWQKGKSYRSIVNSHKISRNTVRELVEQAQGLGLSKQSLAAELEVIADKIITTRYQKNKLSGQAQLALDKHHAQITDWLTKPHMTQRQIHRLLTEQSVMVSESSLRRYIRLNFPVEPNTTVPLPTIPGEQAQPGQFCLIKRA